MTYRWFRASASRTGPRSTSRTYRESPHSGKPSSSGRACASPCQPSGSNSCRASSGPPRQGSAGTVTSSSIGPAASSGLALQCPVRAVLKTSASATASIEEAAYGRSLTYCPRLKSGEDVPRERTSRMGSTSTISAAVQRSSVASG